MRLEVTGLEAASRKMGSYAKTFKTEVAGEMKSAVALWKKLAQESASTVASDTGFLMGKISFYSEAQLIWVIVSQADYSAFVEWGTRMRAVVPAELQAYAAQFKGAHGGGNAKDNIYRWCQRNGIEQSKWWFIYITLMTKGAHPHPFFFIHKARVVSMFQENVNRVITELNERRA